jgi:hypothetical protein
MVAGVKILKARSRAKAFKTIHADKFRSLRRLMLFCALATGEEDFKWFSIVMMILMRSLAVCLLLRCLSFANKTKTFSGVDLVIALVVIRSESGMLRFMRR